MAVIRKLYDWLYKIVMVICKLLLIADIVITSVAVAGRYISFIPDPKWSEEIVLTCMIYMGLLSASLAVRRQAHIRMTAFDRRLPAKLVQVLDLFGDLVVLFLAVVMVVKGLPFAIQVGLNGTYTSLTWLSKFWLYFPVPLSGTAIGLFEFEKIYEHTCLLIGKKTTAEEAA